MELAGSRNYLVIDPELSCPGWSLATSQRVANPFKIRTISNLTAKFYKVPICGDYPDPANCLYGYLHLSTKEGNWSFLVCLRGG